MTLREKIIEHQFKKRESIKAYYIERIGNKVYSESENMLKAKVLRPSLIEEKQFIEYTISTRDQVKQVVQYFNDNYAINFDEADSSKISTLQINTIFDCRDYGVLCLNISRQLTNAYKGPRLLYFPIPLTPMEILSIFSIVLIDAYIVNILNLEFNVSLWLMIVLIFLTAIGVNFINSFDFSKRKNDV